MTMCYECVRKNRVIKKLQKKLTELGTENADLRDELKRLRNGK
jgi:cell division protein FtsB